jgi:hypothetical protein
MKHWTDSFILLIFYHDYDYIPTLSAFTSYSGRIDICALFSILMPNTRFWPNGLRRCLQLLAKFDII